MSESKKRGSNSEKESSGERLWRFGRNINVLGAVAIGGFALIVPGPNVLLASWAGFNAVQAGGYELLRRRSETKRKGKNNERHQS